VRDWGDVRECQACGRSSVWDVEQGRWVHEWAGADHVADVVLTTAAPQLPPCPGRCNARWRRAERVSAEEVNAAEREQRPADVDVVEHRLLPRPGDPVWCEDDAARVVAAVGRLPELVVEVLAREDGRLNAGRSDADGRQSSGAAPASPSPAHDVADSVIRWARMEAEQLLEQVRGWHGDASRVAAAAPTHEDLATSVAALVHFSARWLGDTEHGEEAGGVALRWETDLERTTGQDLLVHRLPVRCPSCQARALTRQDGTDQVDCARCGWRKPYADYVALVADAAEQQRARQREERRAARCRVS